MLSHHALLILTLSWVGTIVGLLIWLAVAALRTRPDTYSEEYPEPKSSTIGGGVPTWRMVSDNSDLPESPEFDTAHAYIFGKIQSKPGLDRLVAELIDQYDADPGASEYIVTQWPRPLAEMEPWIEANQ